MAWYNFWKKEKKEAPKLASTYKPVQVKSNPQKYFEYFVNETPFGFEWMVRAYIPNAVEATGSNASYSAAREAAASKGKELVRSAG
jgi:hypothetical protein